MKPIGEYINGNYNVTIYKDGTKIRRTEDDDFIPSFAENCDVHISNKCDNGCEFCYANCTINGKHGNILNNKFLDTLHPYTEMALNLNFPPHPDLKEFLTILKEKKVIANLTVNQNHFIKNQDYIQDLYENGLFTALGVSLTEANEELVELLHKYKNSVLHVINGLVSESDFNVLKGKGLKMLILGYKDIGRGVNHHKNNQNIIDINQKYLYNNINELSKKFDVIGLDNLGLEQVDMKRFLTDKEWEEFYMGDDGTVTFYIDLVKQTFSKNSLCGIRYDILDDIDDMFNVIVENN